MRCPDCNKFVSYDEPEVEVTDDGVVDEDGEVEVEVQVQLRCAECGCDLKSASVTARATLEAKDEDADLAVCPKNGDDGHDFEVDWEVSPDTRTEGRGRGMRTFYGADLSGEAKCVHCDLVLTGNVDAFEQASNFDEDV